MLLNRCKYYALKKLPVSQKIYNFCKAYVNKCDGDNNSDMKSNGELRVMQEFLPKCKTVFDVGANIGEWTKLAIEINPKLFIHCFEPSNKTYKKLVSNNFQEQITCNNFGISSKNQTLDLHVFSDESGMNSLYKRHGLENSHNIKPQSKAEQVQLKTLDWYCNERQIEAIDFLKVDIEGHELEMFNGAIETFKNNKIKMVQFEYGGCNIRLNA